MENLECLGAVLGLGVVNTEKFYLQIAGLGIGLPQEQYIQGQANRH